MASTGLRTPKHSFIHIRRVVEIEATHLVFEGHIFGMGTFIFRDNPFLSCVYNGIAAFSLISSHLSLQVL